MLHCIVFVCFAWFLAWYYCRPNSCYTLYSVARWFVIVKLTPPNYGLGLAFGLGLVRVPSKFYCRSVIGMALIIRLWFGKHWHVYFISSRFALRFPVVIVIIIK